MYVATSPMIDDEMKERIERHQKDRQGRGWQTVEETIELESVLRCDESDIRLVDCLTLWVNNMLYKTGDECTEKFIIDRCGDILAACSRHGGTTIFVTNEVGWSIVPENPLARTYRDLVGRCNQVMAAGADEVFQVVCGIEVKLKGDGGHEVA